MSDTKAVLFTSMLYFLGKSYKLEVFPMSPSITWGALTPTGPQGDMEEEAYRSMDGGTEELGATWAFYHRAR